MKKHLIIGLGLVTCILVVSMFGCGQGNSSGGGVEYFPHTNGNSWAISNNLVTSGGDTTWATFEGTKLVNNVSTQIYTWTTLSGTSGETYYKVTNDAVLFYGLNGTTTDEPWTALSFPLTKGKSWLCGPSIVTVVDTNLTITVLAGLSIEKTYNNCIQVYTLNPGTPVTGITTYFAPNVGPVKAFGYTNGTLVSTSELISINF